MVENLTWSIVCTGGGLSDPSQLRGLGSLTLRGLWSPSLPQPPQASYVAVSEILPRVPCNSLQTLLTTVCIPDGTGGADVIPGSTSCHQTHAAPLQDTRCQLLPGHTPAF